jgi:flavin reductase (DIM6/NTAB) family NADH-FMN oxidoreductase RutF
MPFGEEGEEEPVGVGPDEPSQMGGGSLQGVTLVTKVGQHRRGAPADASMTVNQNPTGTPALVDEEAKFVEAIRESGVRVVELQSKIGKLFAVKTGDLSSAVQDVSNPRLVQPSKVLCRQAVAQVKPFEHLDHRNNPTS